MRTKLEAPCWPGCCFFGDLLKRRLDYARADGDRFFDASNAHLVAAAEEYYRVMYYGGPRSWNLRDQHMFDTLERLSHVRTTRR